MVHEWLHGRRIGKVAPDKGIIDVEDTINKVFQKAYGPYVCRDWAWANMKEHGERNIQVHTAENGIYSTVYS